MNEGKAGDSAPNIPLGEPGFTNAGDGPLAETNEPLRPMNLGEILDKSVQMFRSHFLLFAGIAAFPALATLLFNLFSQKSLAGLSYSIFWEITRPVLLLICWLAIVVFGALAAAVKCHAASQVLVGKPVTINSAYGAFGQRKARLVGLAIRQGLLVFWPVIPVLFVVVLTARGGGRDILWGAYAAGLVFVLIPCGLLFARYGLAFAATAITDATASDSLKRSIELGRGYRGKVFWAFALPAGIGIALGSGGAGLLAWIGTWRGMSDLHPLLLAELQALWTFASSVCYEPLVAIALTLTYYDLCVRKEAFDIVQLMERAGLHPGQADAVPELTPGLAGPPPASAIALGEMPAGAPGEP